jgi:hypothetical protein
VYHRKWLMFLMEMATLSDTENAFHNNIINSDTKHTIQHQIKTIIHIAFNIHCVLLQYRHNISHLRLNNSIKTGKGTKYRIA